MRHGYRYAVAGLVAGTALVSAPFGLVLCGLGIMGGLADDGTDKEESVFDEIETLYENFMESKNDD